MPPAGALHGTSMVGDGRAGITGQLRVVVELRARRPAR